MPNQITTTGLEVASSDELIAQFTAAFQAIYGADINLDQDTPDGQMMMIFIQSVLDLEDLLVQIYNNFDPDLAIGTVLDQRVTINGIQRKAGTYTLTNITIVTTTSVTLQGLDTYPNDPYTVSDNAGNQWYLQATVSPGGAGTYVYSFRAANPGESLTIPNTITTPVTVVLGVSTVNNPTTYSSLGLNEETDAELKVRRQKSVALASQGYLAGLLAALNNINGITTAIVYENNTGSTDINGIPSHSIWVIIGGTVADVDVATAIYNKRNAGCGMYGAESYIITQVDGSPFEINWDIVEPEDLYIEFDVSSLDGINPPDTVSLLAQIPVILGNMVGVGEQVNINELATVCQQIDPNSLVTNAGFSLSGGGPFTNTLSPSALNKQFAITSGNIAITVV